jgi:hypothetical protein
MTLVYLRNNHQSIGNEKDFRQTLSNRFLEASLSKQKVAIKHITVVGAPRPSGVLYDGGDEDSVRLRYLLNDLAQEGNERSIKQDHIIHPDFEIDSVDFNLGRDFLRETRKTDMLFVSCVPLSETSLHKDPMIIDDAAMQDLKSNGKRYDTLQRHKLADALSDVHTQSHWQDRLEQSGAKLCVTFGGQAEISTQYLKTDRYETVLPTADRNIVDWKTPHETVESFYGALPPDVSMLWLGMLRRKP